MNKEFASQVPVESLSQALRGLTPEERAREQQENVAHIKWFTNEPVNARREGNTIYYDIGKSTGAENSFETQPIPSEAAIVIFDGNKRGNGSMPKEKKPTKTHDRTGLTGFYKGTFYRNGVSQPNKNRGK